MRTTRYLVDGLDWGPIHLIRPLPEEGDPWGCLAPLRGSPIGDLLPQVEGKALSEALHGNPYPLIRTIGPAPRDLLRLIPKCQTAKGCLLWNAKKCHPNPKMPGCYIPPEGGEPASIVVHAWAEGCYVVIVGEGEFSLG